MKIKKGDLVLIITGKDKGKKGKILESFPLKKKIIVENINIKKKTVKARKAGQKGQIVELPVAFDASNVKLICSKCSQGVRVGYQLQGGVKKRICRKCKQAL